MQTKLSPNGITAVLFDLDGTLRHSRPPFNQTLLNYTRSDWARPDSPRAAPERAALGACLLGTVARNAARSGNLRRFER